MADVSRLDPADAALAGVLTAGPDRPVLTRDELAARTQAPAPLLDALEREGFLTAEVVDGEPRYRAADVEAVSAGLRLVEAGLPVGEVLDLARRFDAAMRAVADQAVDVFLRFVRDPVRASAASEEDAASRLVAAFESMLPATTTVVAHHARRLLLAAAWSRVQRELE